MGKKQKSKHTEFRKIQNPNPIKILDSRSMLGNLSRIFSSMSLKTIATSSRLMFSTMEGSPYWPKYDALTLHHLKGPHTKKRPNKNPLVDRPFTKGVVIRTIIRKPRKPNSANRKCVLVKLSNGKEM